MLRGLFWRNKFAIDNSFEKVNW